ncbi:hypothetical protein [Nocardia cyriacigeorgica]|uniref:Tail assembly chaperone n=1 Tax=Nocardia cyriacigeorgica TaxID=135487 RepID=A0A5R8NBP0_9NOCA|nr:hypothetical protein [Nocardia cyriacigeorgica]TLF72923.1 hypothetical protein FEK34_28285 [Nocardia cyriacigeorgica]
MAATKRAAAARRTPPAAARRTQPEPIDILAEFNTEEKPPVPIRLGEVEADVRRGFSGDEVVRFHRLVGETKFGEVLELITTNGAQLWEFIGSLTPEYASKALNRIINVSELYEGNLLAPLPGFAPNPAGAPPSPESATTTE